MFKPNLSFPLDQSPEAQEALNYATMAGLHAEYLGKVAWDAFADNEVARLTGSPLPYSTEELAEINEAYRLAYELFSQLESERVIGTHSAGNTVRRY